MPFVDLKWIKTLADVFISCSRAHRDDIVRLAGALRKFAIDVWFDIELRAGTVFADEIQARLTQAKCVLVVWTKDALEKGPRGWVYSEADWAHQRKKLIQSQLERVALPPPFFSSQTPPIDLRKLKGRQDASEAIRSALPELLKHIGDYSKRPGLSSLIEAQANDQALLEWADRFSRDPILTAHPSMFDDARARVKSTRLTEERRIRRRDNLAEELRLLATATQAAPLATFGYPSIGLMAQTATVSSAAYGGNCPRDVENLFSPTALRAIVCHSSGAGIGAERADSKPCLAIVAAGRLFVVDAGSGAAAALADRNIPMARLEAVLLTGAALSQSADLNELYADTASGHVNTLLPVYGPSETQRMVDDLNSAAGFDGASQGLQAWGPAPGPGRSVVVFEGDGLVVSAFTTQEDAFAGRVGYRFDYRGRSLVIGGDGRVVSAAAAANADVVLQDAQDHGLESARSTSNATNTARRIQSADAGVLILTSPENQEAVDQQVAEVCGAGSPDLTIARASMLVELPIASGHVNVRALT